MRIEDRIQSSELAVWKQISYLWEDFIDMVQNLGG